MEPLDLTDKFHFLFDGLIFRKIRIDEIVCIVGQLRYSRNPFNFCKYKRANMNIL